MGAVGALAVRPCTAVRALPVRACSAVRALPVRPCKTRVLASDGSTNAALEVSRARAFQALRHRDFRLLFTGQAVSLVGDAAFLTALGWKTFTIAGAGKIGLVLSVQGAGLLTTLLIGGALADRYERRRMMILSDVWRFVAVGTLAGLDATGHLGLPSLVILAGIAGLGDGLFYPAVGGIIPLVVDRAQDRKSTRLNSSHLVISYAVFCLKQ